MEILFLISFCTFALTVFASDWTNSSHAIVINKFLHKNGLKEFTVSKNIKGDDCVCSCLCATLNSVDAISELKAVGPTSEKLRKLIQSPMREFQIAKQIRGNICNCSCACRAQQKEAENGTGNGHQQEENSVQEANDGVAQWAEAAQFKMALPKPTTLKPNKLNSETHLSAGSQDDHNNTIELASSSTATATSLTPSTTLKATPINTTINATISSILSKPTTTAAIPPTTKTTPTTTLTTPNITPFSTTNSFTNNANFEFTTNALVTTTHGSVKNGTLSIPTPNQTTNITLLRNTTHSSNFLTELDNTLVGSPPPVAEEDDNGQGQQAETQWVTTAADPMVDPIFKAKVANLLNRLKMQLYHLREQEKQKEGNNGITTKTVTTMDDNNMDNMRESGKLLPMNNSNTNATTVTQQNDTHLNMQQEEEANGVGKEMEEKMDDDDDVAKEVEGKSNAINNTKNGHLPPIENEMNINSSRPMDDGANGTADKMNGGNSTTTTKLVGDEAANVTSVFNERNLMSVESTKVTESNENATGEINAVTDSASTADETTLSPAFKARVANLLNRLKEQLNKMRELQRQTNAAVKNLQSGKTADENESRLFSDKTSPVSNATESLTKGEETFQNNTNINNSTEMRKVEDNEFSSFITETPAAENEFIEDEKIEKIPRTNFSQEMLFSSAKKNDKKPRRHHHHRRKGAKEKEKLFPLPNEFMVHVDQPIKDKNKSMAEEDDRRRGRIILLPAPPQRREFFSSKSQIFDENETLIGGNVTEKIETFEGIEPIHGNASALPTIDNKKNEINATKNITQLADPHYQHKQQEEPPNKISIDFSTIQMPTYHRNTVITTTEPPIFGMPIKRRLPEMPLMIERLEFARKLREEQLKLEMLEAIRREQLGTDDPDPHLEERRRLIENRLAQLAQSERIHREMLTHYHRRHETDNVASQSRSSDNLPSPSPMPCETMRRFIRWFRIDNPREWIRQNCQLAKRHFPNASCEQIEALLSKCVR